MRIRRALILLPVLAALALPSAADARTASARITACTAAPALADRKASFEGEMVAIRGAVRMQMRFTLQARGRRGTWARVNAPAFGAWLTSEPGKAGFVYEKTIANLIAPARYRALVHFRWLAATGTVIARERRVTRSCRQPDQRPDLRALDLVARSGVDAGTLRYGISLRNSGRTGAGSFVVTVAPAGREAVAQRVYGLAAGERTLVWVEAPACSPGSQVTVRVDATNEVDEAREANGTASFTCPV